MGANKREKKSKSNRTQVILNGKTYSVKMKNGGIVYSRKDAQKFKPAYLIGDVLRKAS